MGLYIFKNIFSKLKCNAGPCPLLVLSLWNNHADLYPLRIWLPGTENRSPLRSKPGFHAHKHLIYKQLSKLQLEDGTVNYGLIITPLLKLWLCPSMCGNSGFHGVWEWMNQKNKYKSFSRFFLLLAKTGNVLAHLEEKHLNRGEVHESKFKTFTLSQVVNVSKETVFTAPSKPGKTCN